MVKYIGLALVLTLSGCTTERIVYKDVYVPVVYVPGLDKSFEKTDLTRPELPHQNLSAQVWEVESEENTGLISKALWKSVKVLINYSANLEKVYKYYTDLSVESQKNIKKLEDGQK